jgi:hypothetical protein
MRPQKSRLQRDPAAASSVEAYTWDGLYLRCFVYAS